MANVAAIFGNMFIQRGCHHSPNEINGYKVNTLEFTQCSRSSKVEMKGLLTIYLFSLAEWLSVPDLAIKME